RRAQVGDDRGRGTSPGARAAGSLARRGAARHARTRERGAGRGEPAAAPEPAGVGRRDAARAPGRATDAGRDAGTTRGGALRCASRAAGGGGTMRLRALLMMCTLLLPAGCARKEDEGDEATAVVPVRTAVVEEREFTDQLEAPGQWRSSGDVS